MYTHSTTSTEDDSLKVQVSALPGVEPPLCGGKMSLFPGPTHRLRPSGYDLPATWPQSPGSGGAQGRHDSTAACPAQAAPLCSCPRGGHWPSPPAPAWPAAVTSLPLLSSRPLTSAHRLSFCSLHPTKAAPQGPACGQVRVSAQGPSAGPVSSSQPSVPPPGNTFSSRF